MMNHEKWLNLNAASQAVRERMDGPWRVLPIEGRFELVYEDEAGARSIRRVVGQELKVGPGKTLLGAVDRDRDAYRGFRADRIRLLVDMATGAVVERNILDWLLKRAIRTAREEARARAARASGAPAADAFKAC